MSTRPSHLPTFSLPLFGLNAQPLVYDQNSRQYLFEGSALPRVTKILEVLDKSFRIPWALKEMELHIEKNWKHAQTYMEDDKKKIIKEGKKAFETISMNAMGRGSNVHRWIERDIASESPALPTDPEQLKPIQSFLTWEKDHNVKWLASEFIIASKTHQYAGTVDFVAIVDNNALVLGDFKVSNRISLEYFLQTAAYQIALEELLKETFYSPNNVRIPAPMDLMSADELSYLHLLWNFQAAGVPPQIDYRLIVRIPADGKPVESLKVPTDIKKDCQAFLGACSMYDWYKHAKEQYPQEEWK